MIVGVGVAVAVAVGVGVGVGVIVGVWVAVAVAVGVGVAVAVAVGVGVDVAVAVGVGVAVAVGVGVGVDGGICTEPSVGGWLGSAAPCGSEKDGDGLVENRTSNVWVIEVVPHVIARVISATSPSGIVPNGAIMSATLMSISPSVSPASWENAGVNPDGTVKRTVSGRPLLSASVESKLMHDSG